jgi:hypothetical protein
MTGIHNSNNSIAALVVVFLSAALPPAVVADDLFLEGAERLSGSVRAISENGSVLLDTPLSPELVPLKGDSVRKVVFSEPAEKPVAANCGVTLTNGDVLPGDIESIDDKNLTLNSSVAGRFVLPRELIYSLQLGVHKSNTLYAGPDGLEGWSREPATAAHWTFDNDGFQVQGTGRIGRDFELPPQFIVRFKLSWDTSPNIKFYFAAAPGNAERAQDCYYLQFAAAGIEIKRESASGRRWTTIANLNRLPKQYPGKHVTIEIRVDRPGRTLQLFLNDEPEGPFKDPIARPPVAGGIAFESMLEEGAKAGISDIEVLDWNLKGERRRTEDRGDVTKDVLIGIKSERFSGKFIEAKKGPEGMLYVFKSAFQEEALEVPESEVATVFFVGKTNADADVVKNPFILQLCSGGSLHVASCSFSAELVEATHPLLGRLTLRRAGVSAFERVSPKPKDAPEP